MNRLTYEELILLDNLIYLELDAKENEALIDIVYKLLSIGDFDYLAKKVGNCIIKMSDSEWIDLLQQILIKQNLIKLKIKYVDEYYKYGMKYACFVNEEDNLIVVFRGTSTSEEWDDNAHSAYEIETEEQIDALNYINSLEYDDITVTGHSKGGNKSKYVAILSPKVNRCLSVNGQGFSNEFVSKYEAEINENKYKIVSINAKYDYVNCLFNKIPGKCWYIKTDFQLNPIYYHKANILLDNNGVLKHVTSEGIMPKIINNFSVALLSDVPCPARNLIIDAIISTVELLMCTGNEKRNILNIAEEFMILNCNKVSIEENEIFNVYYILLEILILPLLFWKELINVEENKSKDLLQEVIRKISELSNTKIRKLMVIDNVEVKIVYNVLNAISDLIFMLENEIP